MTKPNKKIKVIKKGDTVHIDRGILGFWVGKVTFIRSYLWGGGIGCFGEIETPLGDKHAFDTFVHGIDKL